MASTDLAATARALVADGQGILASALLAFHTAAWAELVPPLHRLPFGAVNRYPPN